MKVFILMVAVLVMQGCSGTAIKGETPAIAPHRPAGEVTIEMMEGDMICVTEKNDPTLRTCVPRVHDVEDDA